MKKQKENDIEMKKEILNEITKLIKIKGYKQREVSILMNKNELYLSAIKSRLSDSIYSASIKKLNEILDFVNQLPAKEGYFNKDNLKTFISESAIVEITINDEVLYLVQSDSSYGLTKDIKAAKVFNEDALISIEKNTGKKVVVFE